MMKNFTLKGNEEMYDITFKIKHIIYLIISEKKTSTLIETPITRFHKQLVCTVLSHYFQLESLRPVFFYLFDKTEIRKVCKLTQILYLNTLHLKTLKAHKSLKL